MSDANDVKFSLKVTVNKQKTKVIFAEVESDFADVLLSFLTLPLGKIVRVLNKHYGAEESPTIGSLTSLYNGLANIDNGHFLTEVDKQMLLNPMSAFDAELRKLKLDISDCKSTKYFTCEDWNCVYARSLNISMHCATGICRCGKTVKREISIKKSQADDGGVFTINTASFVISDDLRMVPNQAVSVMQTLRNLGITDTRDGVELMNVTFGLNEIMDLLKASLVSSTTLSDVVFNRIKRNTGTRRSKPGIFIHHEKEKGANNSNSNKMLLKVMVQKSTNKFLFAQADEDCVDFLFSLLTIPFGGVECLLDGNTCVNSMDNLYMSVADLIDDKYMASPDMKNKLIKPKLPQGYMSKNQILPLSEQVVLYYYRDNGKYAQWLTYSSSAAANPVIRYAEGNYVKGPKMFMVSDELTVTPSSMSSSLSVLNELKIPLSDVKEVEVHIGLHEGLRILKASLTSTCALTDGLKTSPVLSQKPIAETLNLNIVACTYAASILRDDGIAVTEEKIRTLLKAANLTVESCWPSFFAKLCEKRNIEETKEESDDDFGFSLFD